MFKETENLYVKDPFFNNAINIAEKIFDDNFNDKENTGSISSSLNYFDSIVSQIVYCSDKKNLIVLTRNGTLYKSVDEGFKFEKIKINKYKNEQIISIQQNVNNKNNFLIIKNKYSLITYDCLENINKINTESMITKIDFHIENLNIFLIKTKGKCKLKEIKKKSNMIDTKMICKGDNLYMTENRGKNFKLIKENIEDFNWLTYSNYNEITEKNEVNIVQNSRILIIKYEDDYYEFKTNGYIKNKSLYYSDDYFKTEFLIIEKIDKFVISSNRVYITKLMDNKLKELELFVFKSNENILIVQKVILPFKFLYHYSYTICYNDNNVTYMHISHHLLHNNFGHLYISDDNINEFKLIKKYVSRNKDGFIDFEKIKEIDGILFVNSYDEKEILDYLIYKKMKNKTKNYVNYKKKLNKITFISYNNGYTWNRLKPKIIDNENKLLNNYDGFLNLKFFNKNNFSKFYTIKESIGIIISSGNIGNYLSNSSKELKTFFSIDAGRTFKIINNEDSIYEIGNQGGLLLFENNNIKTNKILFSWNYGKTINSFPLYTKKINIINILMENKMYSDKFLVIATEIFKGNEIGIIIPIDFSKFLPKICIKGNISDYEKWEIKGINNECIMGKTYVRERRKLNKNCFINNDISEFKLYKNCECNKNDYICDKNYFFSKNNCLKIKDYEDLEPMICSNFYYKSNGYWKIPNNSCTGKTKYDKIKIICSKTKYYFIIFLISFTVIFLLSIIIFYINRKFLNEIFANNINWNLELKKEVNKIKLKNN